MKRLRLTFGAGVLLTICVLGVTASPSLARAPSGITMISMTPAQVTGGKSFTINFELMRAGVARPVTSVHCYALAGGRLAQLLDQGTDGIVGHCTWAIGRRTSGKTFDGIISGLSKSGTWNNLGLDLPIS